MSKFRFGDIVVGNSDTPYRLTRKGVKCRVVATSRYGDRMTVVILGGTEQFSVETRYFDLVRSHRPADSECEFLDKIQRNMRGW